MSFSTDVCIVGGCGHVGFPLGLAFADRGLTVALYDVDPLAVEEVNAGRLPFAEPGAQDVLDRVGGILLHASTDAAVVAEAEHVVVVIGTPVDEHLNPDLRAVPDAVCMLYSSYISKP